MIKYIRSHIVLFTILIIIPCYMAGNYPVSGCIAWNSSNTACNFSLCKACKANTYLLNYSSACGGYYSCCLSAALPNCVNCDGPTSNSTCTQCVNSSFYINNNGTCALCTTISMCSACDGIKCTACSSSVYLLTDGKCFNCMGLTQCLNCNQTNYCTKCITDYYAAISGTCQRCSNLFFQCNRCSNDGSICTYCNNKYYINNSTCKLCNMTIPNCTICDNSGTNCIVCLT
jgi:hypothetical protein